MATVTLAAFEFPQRNVIWLDRSGWSPYSGGNHENAIDGTSIVWAPKYPAGGRPFTLQFSGLAWSDVLALESLVTANPKTPLSLVIPGQNIDTQVCIRHEDAPPFTFEGPVPIADTASTGVLPVYTSVLKLREW